MAWTVKVKEAALEQLRWFGKKTGRKVKARVSVDKSLIGGVKIVIGDKVKLNIEAEAILQK